MRYLLAFYAVISALTGPLGVPAAAHAQTTSADSAKYVAIRQLLAVQRTDSMILAGIESASAKQSPTLPPGMPAGFLDSLRSRAHRDIGQFIERLVPIYDSLYTAAEIKDLLAFYQTRLGQRVIGATPRLMEATMMLGQQWGMQLAGSVMVDLAGQPPKRPQAQATTRVDTNDTTYAMNEVDQPVQVVTIPNPRYPKTLRDSLIEGRVELRYIVDTTGHAEPNSIRVLSKTREEFVEPAKEAILAGVFRPARFRSRLVRQLVQQRISFRP